jgi:hypothetical protein
MNRAVEARGKMPVNRSKLLAVPMPSRDERDREYDKSVEWQRIFAHEFNDLYREWLPTGVTSADALNRLFIPYVASWSFGEHIPVVEHERERSDPTSLGAAYARLATLLSHRLDWSAIEAGASAADVVGARVELHKAREEAVQADLKLEQLRTETRARRRKIKAAFLILAVLLLGAIAVLLWQAYQARREAEANKALVQMAVSSVNELGFSWNEEERKLEAEDDAKDITSLDSVAIHAYKLFPRRLSLKDCALLESVRGIDRFFLVRNLDLSGCSSLKAIDEIAELSLLESINLTGCTALPNINAVAGLKELETLNLSGCSSLRDVDVLKNVRSLKQVDLTGCKLLQRDALQKLSAALSDTEIIFPDGSKSKK